MEPFLSRMEDTEQKEVRHELVKTLFISLPPGMHFDLPKKKG
jgi:hypothetical protein